MLDNSFAALVAHLQLASNGHRRPSRRIQPHLRVLLRQAIDGLQSTPVIDLDTPPSFVSLVTRSIRNHLWNSAFKSSAISTCHSTHGLLATVI
jgi:hypothetical protein